MNFLDFEYNPEPSIIKEKFEVYRKYLENNHQSFPPSAYEFSTADWHYNAEDPRCPHDAWVESLNIAENHLPKTDNKKGIKIELMLLGAYQNGQIKISYDGVRGYNLTLFPDSFEVKSHGDWIIDEIRLSEKGWLIHEIKFWLNGNWQIECEDIQYQWLPFEK
jgi:hypothetical protein